MYSYLKCVSRLLAYFEMKIRLYSLSFTKSFAEMLMNNSITIEKIQRANMKPQIQMSKNLSDIVAESLLLISSLHA